MENVFLGGAPEQWILGWGRQGHIEGACFEEGLFYAHDGTEWMLYGTMLADELAMHCADARCDVLKE